LLQKGLLIVITYDITSGVSSMRLIQSGLTAPGQVQVSR